MEDEDEIIDYAALVEEEEVTEDGEEIDYTTLVEDDCPCGTDDNGDCLECEKEEEVVSEGGAAVGAIASTAQKIKEAQGIDSKSNTMSKDEWGYYEDEEDLVNALNKDVRYNQDFEFSEDTNYEDVVQIYDKKQKKYHYVPLNTAYNRENYPDKDYSRDFEAFLKATTFGNTVDQTVKPDPFGEPVMSQGVFLGYQPKIETDEVAVIDKDGTVKSVTQDKQKLGTAGRDKAYKRYEVEIEDPNSTNPDDKVTIQATDQHIERALERYAQTGEGTVESNLRDIVLEDEELKARYRLDAQLVGKQNEVNREVDKIVGEVIKNDFTRDILSKAPGYITKSNMYQKFRDDSDITNQKSTLSNQDAFVKSLFPLTGVFPKEQEWQAAKEQFDQLTFPIGGKDNPNFEKEYNIPYLNYINLSEERTNWTLDKVKEGYNNPNNYPFQVLKQKTNTWVKENWKNKQVKDKALQLEIANPEASKDEINLKANFEVKSDLVSNQIDVFASGGFLGIDTPEQNLVNISRDFHNRNLNLQEKRNNAYIEEFKKNGGDAAAARAKAIELHPVSEEDVKAQNELASAAQNFLDDEEIDIYKNIEGDYGNTIYTRGERKDESYIRDKIKEYQYADTDWLNSRIFENNSEIVQLAMQLSQKSDWYKPFWEEGSVSLATQIYDAVGDVAGSDDVLARDIERIRKIAETGELPLKLTTIPNSDDPLVKAWNDAIEDRSVLGISKVLNVDWTTSMRDGFWGNAGNWGSAMGFEELTYTENKHRLFNEIEASGIELTDQDKYDMQLLIGNLEIVGGAVPEYTKMGAEMGATFLMTGGAGNIANLTRWGATNVFRGMGAVGIKVAPKTAEAIVKYTTGVGVEFAGLQGASIMEQQVFDKEGMSAAHNFRMALTMQTGRIGVAKIGDKITKSLYRTAEKNANKGNYALHNVLNWSEKTPGLESINKALNFSVKQPGSAALLMQGETAIEGLLHGESWDEIFHNLTDGDQLFETYASFALMQMMHPRQAFKNARETFRREVDRRAGDIPMWNSGYRQLGLDPVRGTASHTNEAVDAAVKKKVREIKQEGGNNVAEQIAYINSLGNKLKQKGSYHEFVAETAKAEAAQKQSTSLEKYNKKYEELNPKEKADIDANYEDLAIFHNTQRLNATVNNLNKGGQLTPEGLLNLNEAGYLNDGKAVIYELMVNGGMSELAATRMYQDSQIIANYAKSEFSMDPKALRGEAGKAFIANSMEIYKLNGEVNRLKEVLDTYVQGEAKDRNPSAEEIRISNEIKMYEDLLVNLENANATNIKSQQLIEMAEIYQPTIDLARKAGHQVFEGNTAEVNKLKEEFAGIEFSEIESGLMGIDIRKKIINPETGRVINNPNYNKPIQIFNTDIVRPGTASHEGLGHASQELVVGDAAVNKRKTEIMEKNPEMSEEIAGQQALDEAFDYIDKVKDRVKSKRGGEYEKIEAEMDKVNLSNGQTWQEYKQSVKDGMPRDMNVEKEWLAEFVEMADVGGFDTGIKSKTTKPSKEAPSSLSPRDMKPEEYADFILEGGTRDKSKLEGAVKSDRNKLIRLQNKYGTEPARMIASEKASERAPVKIESIKSVGKDGEVISAERVEKQLGKVAGVAWQKYGSKVGGLDRREYTNRAISELYKPLKASALDPKKKVPEGGYSQWIKKWDGTRQSFEKYTLQKGLEELKLLARDAFGVKSNEVRAQEKRLSDKVGKEGDREFDVVDEGAQAAVESAGEGKASAPEKMDRQVSQFEGKEAKAKEKEILEIFEPLTPQELTKRSEKGLGGTPKQDVAKVAELLFDANGNRITDPSKNPTFSKKLVNEKGETIPKGSKEKGIGYSDSEFGNIQKYFQDNANLSRFLKTLMKHSFVPNQTRINSKGEIIEISKDVRGRGLGLPKRFVEYFYETLKDPKGEFLSPSGRTKGTKVQLQPGQAKKLKSEFINPTPEVLKKIKKDLLIGEDLANYDRTLHGQFAKGMASVEALKTANEATRKRLPKDSTPKLDKQTQLEANTRGGLSDFAASNKNREKAREEITKKIKPRSFVGEMQGMASWIKGFAKDMDIAIAKEIGADGNVRDLIGQQRLSDFASKVLSKYFGEPILSGQTWSNTKLGKGMWFSTDFRNKVLEEFRKEQKGKTPLTTKEYNALKLLMGSPGLDPMKTNPFGGKQGSKWIDKVNTNYEGLDLFIDQTFKMLKENPEYLGEFLAMMKGSSSSNSHFWRNASQVIGKHINWADKAMINPKKKGVGVGEHALVQNQAGEFMTKAILESIARGNPQAKNIAKKLLNENYFQILISHGLDGKLTQIGLQSSMPKGFWESWNKALETGNINEAWSVWSRYFNEKINKIKGADGEFGFNPNKIDLLNRKTGKIESLADILGIGKKEFGNDVLNPEIIAKQQELIQKWSTRQEGFTKPEQLRERLAIELDMLNAKRDASLKTSKEINSIENPIYTYMASSKTPNKLIVDKANTFDKALDNARKINKEKKKARVFDFDDTVARTNSKVFAERAGERIELTAEEFAMRGDELIAEGYKMDFSDFNRVVDGKKGPLFDVMKKMKEAAGDRDLFILTARAPESALAIKQFLDAMGIKIPLENITGLGNSTGKAKADWLVKKAAEGYNDFYFADDAPQNVKAVRDAMEVLDVKSKVQQARMNASNKMNDTFNKIIEESTGIESQKVFSDIKAEIRGEKIRRQRFFIPPSAEDFTGLLYRTLGKGKKGEAAMEFYKESLIDPYTRAMENLSQDRVNLMADFKDLKKQLEVPKELRKKTKSGFRREDAVRAYLWQKTGKEIPGISKTDLAELNKIMESDPRLQAFADQILEITKGDGYSTPEQGWVAGTITTDLISTLNKTKRAKYLEAWKENVDVVFSKENLNKLEAAYGKKYREALENSLTRMKAGSNRTSSGNKVSNRVLDYINNANGTIMFLNTRSAVLQTISAANFTNWTFNNPLRMGQAFANQPQYWKDFVKLMNSDYLVDRRNGLKLNISESEIANAAATGKNKAKAAMSYILEKGYLPTKFADSFAIASGGAMFYRNRIKDLMKNNGMTKAQAEKRAMEDFRQISEKSQQSSDPSKISQQQSSDLGRVVLAFANTPMQYARIQKRAIQDIVNGRGSMKENLGKIVYYGFLQNLIFNTLQQGLFALGFGDGEVGETEEKKIINTVNGMVDSQLRGLGMAGVTIQVLKNLGIDIYDRSQKDRPEYSDAWQKLLEFSPAIKSKLSKLKSAAYPFDSKKRRQEVFDKGFSLDNPAYASLAKVVSAATNLPLDRLYTKFENIQGALDENTETWKAVAMLAGWPAWQLKTTADVNQAYRDDPSQWGVWEQKSILRQFGYSDDEIKKLKNTNGRVEAIKKLQKEKDKQMFPKDDDKKDFHAPTKKEKEENQNLPLTSKQKLTSMKKGEQVRHLTNYGLSKAEIRALRYEADRVAKLIELAGKPEKVDSLMQDINYGSLVE